MLAVCPERALLSFSYTFFLKLLPCHNLRDEDHPPWVQKSPIALPDLDYAGSISSGALESNVWFPFETGPQTLLLYPGNPDSSHEVLGSILTAAPTFFFSWNKIHSHPSRYQVPGTR